MKLVERVPVLGSSSDPSKLSLTVKMILLGLIPALIGLIKVITGVELAEVDLKVFVEQIVQLVQLLTTLVAVVGGIIGAGRKLYLKVLKR